jgi:hypothetical protein
VAERPLINLGSVVTEIREEDLARELEERGLPPHVFGVDVPVLDLEAEQRDP